MSVFEVIPVIQTDRDAAARYAMAATGASASDKEIKACIDGGLDATYLVQGFAHHRVNCIAAWQAEQKPSG